MSATNKTTHYELPVFVGGDMPGWLTDFNGAMNTIDGGIYEAKSAADGAQSSADTANANITTLAETVDSVGGRVTTLEGTVASQGGNIDTINSLIGHGEPTTQDKTIIGAINELAAEIPGPGQPVDADDVSYSNTTSGLTATNAQDAIDEVAGDVATLDAKVGFPTRLNQGAPQYSPDGGTTWANFSGALSIDEVESAESYVDAYTQTMTYTFLTDHNEVLISANAVQYFMATGASASAKNVAITCASSDVTVNEYHDTHYTLIDGANTNYIFGDRHTFHIENVSAGDSITFTATCDPTGATSASAPHQVLEYTIFTVN